MALYFIGLGLSDEKDISVKGLEVIKKCDFIYLESYTSKLTVDKKALEKFYKKEVIEADRNLVENEAENTILKNAKNKEVAFLVIGDVFSATTHTDLLQRANELKIKTKVINNASILTAVGITGLQLYKFGKTASIPIPQPGYEPITPYNILYQNQKIQAHTLFLLDITPERLLTIKEAIKILLDIEKQEGKNIFDEETYCVGCARIGSEKAIIKAGPAAKLMKQDFGEGPYCLIVPSKLHFMEEEILKKYNI
jgi:diphthine synthase